LPVFAGFSAVFTGFFHRPGKNTFCRGKNPTLAKNYENWVTVDKVIAKIVGLTFFGPPCIYTAVLCCICSVC